MDAQKKQLMDLGVQFANEVKEKFYSNLAAEDWLVSTATNAYEEQYSLVNIKQSDRSVDAKVKHLSFNTLFLGSNVMSKQFGMRIAFDNSGDYVIVGFDASVWETDREEAKIVFSDFASFLRNQGFDTLLSTHGRFTECINGDLKFVSTGEKSDAFLAKLTNLGAKGESILSISGISERNYFIHSTQNHEIRYVEDGKQKVEAI